MSESVSVSPSKYEHLGSFSMSQRAMFELALDFIDSEVIGSIAMTADQYGVTGVTVTREPGPMPLYEEESDETFSPEYVSEQLNLSRPTTVRASRRPSADDLTNE